MKPGDSDGRVDWIRLFPADFLGDTGDLTNEEFGIYARLVLTYYRDHSPLSRAPGRLERVVGAFTDSERLGLATILARHFIEDELDGAPVWRHKRCDRELLNSTSAYKNRIAGAEKARQRKAAIGALRAGISVDISSDTKPDNSVDTKPDIRADIPSRTYNLQPTTNNLQPTPLAPSLRLGATVPTSLDPEKQENPPLLVNASRGGARKKKTEVDGTLTSAVWSEYSTRYVDRYGIMPVRNAKVNSQLKQFVARVGADEAPHIAGWYVGHNKAWYVGKGHTIAVLLADAEMLRTEWATNRPTTQTQARQADETATRGNVFSRLLGEHDNDEDDRRHSDG